MRCADPILCHIDSKGKRIFRHFSLASRLFKQYLHSAVYDCGKCLICRKKKAYELACRCVLHASMYSKNCFITLTYDEKKEGYNNDFAYGDIQRFKKRLRRRTKDRIAIFNVHEYGKNNKKHWHLVIFNYDFDDKVFFSQRNSIPYYTSELLSKLWPHGHHTIGDVNEASAMYQAQYMEKDFRNNYAGTKSKSHSQHRGIGKPYFEKNYKQILTLGYIPINGKKLPIPRYFQKIAYKHWCHYNKKDAFFDTLSRKALFRPFKIDETPSKEISDLYDLFLLNKKDKIIELSNQWSETINTHLTTNSKPDFIKSAENKLYDLKNQNKKEKF